MLHKGSFNRIFYNRFQIRTVKAIGLFGKDCRIDTGCPLEARRPTASAFMIIPPNTELLLKGPDIHGIQIHSTLVAFFR